MTACQEAEVARMTAVDAHLEVDVTHPPRHSDMRWHSWYPTELINLIGTLVMSHWQREGAC